MPTLPLSRGEFYYIQLPAKFPLNKYKEINFKILIFLAKLRPLSAQ
jgi:hypothetical protein